MTSLSKDFPPPEPPSKLTMGPTGYTGGMLVSADNDSIACVSNSKKVLTMIALASPSFCANHRTKSSPALVLTRLQNTLVGTGLTKLGTSTSVSELLNSTTSTSLFKSSQSDFIYNVNPRNAALEVKKTKVGTLNSLATSIMLAQNMSTTNPTTRPEPG
ncbi:hypothetical protein HanRHA438_Chr13g0623431 [Helianthus annuus]|nr:hypothetical protein HanRHA438_Chr13g0623431 [Helianthus annuus]